MTVTMDQPVTVDDIVDSLREHVWTLIRADKIDAAMVLLQASLDDYLAAAAVPDPVTVLEGIILDHDAPSCEVAIRPRWDLVLAARAG